MKYGSFKYGAEKYGTWQAPIINRSNGDYYTHTDLNRVGKNVQYLADLLNSFGYAVTVAPKINWAIGDIPNATQMTQYLTDLTAIKTKFYGATALPPNMDGLTATIANNIELLESEIKRNIDHMLLSFSYSGEALCGEA